MSIQVNYEQVSNTLAVKVARLELQNATYENLIQQLQSQLQEVQQAQPTPESGESDVE